MTLNIKGSLRNTEATLKIAAVFDPLIPVLKM